MCSKPQIHHKSTPRPHFDIVPPPFDIKSMPNVTPPSESAENFQIQFENKKNAKTMQQMSCQRYPKPSIIQHVIETCTSGNIEAAYTSSALTRV